MDESEEGLSKEESLLNEGMISNLDHQFESEGEKGDQKATFE